LRLLIDGAAGGAWNMAADAALLVAVAESGECALRFYGWAPATVSLGYFQPYADRERHAPSLACPVVRRSTGGGAIVHDRELTYSLALPLEHPLGQRAELLYDAVHDALIELLAAQGIQLTRCPGPSAGKQTPKSAQPFLCFQRRACGDVLLGNFKVCGSAQRRGRGAVLQHGSLLLATSPWATELPGLRELTGIDLDPTATAKAWATALAARLDLQAQSSQWTIAETARTSQISESQYASAGWTAQR